MYKLEVYGRFVLMQVSVITVIIVTITIIYVVDNLSATGKGNYEFELHSTRALEFCQYLSILVVLSQLLFLL